MLAKRIHRLARVALALLLALAAPAARADALDTILDYLAKAGVIDGAVKDAKPLIQCLVQSNGNPAPCVNVKSLAEQQGKAAAKKYAPDDPKIQGVVQLVVAVDKGDWVRVIDVAGLKVLLPLACDAGLATTGPLKGFVCKDAMKKIVAKAAEPAVRGILAALASGKPQDIVWEVISLAGNLDLACELLPDFPGKDVPCGVFGRALAELGGALVDAAKWGGKIVVSAADATEKLLFGDDSHMPYDKYYALYWLPWFHKGTQLCLTQDCKGLDALEKRIWDPCVDYFDSHNQYRSTAKKTCDDMEDKRFTPGVRAMAKAMAGAGEAHVATLRPWARTWAVEDYGKDTLAQRKQFFVSNCEATLRKNFPFPEPNPALCEAIRKSPQYELFKPVFDKFYAKCVSDVQQQLPAPTAWQSACARAQPEFVAVLAEEKNALQKNIEQIVAAGCFPPKGWSAAGGLKLECASYPALAACYAGLKAGAEQQRCTVNAAKADAALGLQIVAALGAKRCRVDSGAVVCTRPWKVQSCHAELAARAQGLVVKPTLKCGADLASFEALKKDAQQLLFALNGGSKQSTGMKTEKGEGVVMVLPATQNNCQALADPLAIRCTNMQAVAALKSAQPSLKFDACPADPNKDGADAPCLVPVYRADGGPATASARAVVPGGGVPAPAQPPIATPAPARPAPPAARTANVQPPARNALPAVQSPAARVAPPAVTAPAARGAGSGGFDLPPPPQAAREQRVANAVRPQPPARSGSADVERLLGPAGCTRSGAADRYACTSRAGFDRCEALRRQQKVRACSLVPGR